MKVFRISILAVLSLLLTGCAGGGISQQSESAFVSGNGVAVFVKPADRKIAPIIQGPTLSGVNVSLPQRMVTVVNVWASWCAPCRAEAPLLEDFATKLKGKVQFAGILTRDNMSSAISFVKRFKVTYPIFIDDSILAKFRGSLIPNAIPTTLIIDANGKVAVRISGAVTFALLDNLLKKVLQESVHA